MKKLLAVLLGVLVSTFAIVTYELYPAQRCEAQWFGSTDQWMLEQVQKDLTRGCGVLKVRLMSFGGPVHTSIEIAQEIRRARDRGVTVEIHGRSVVVSGGVIVLGAGSPGYRYISKHSIVMVHGVQKFNGWSNACLSYKPSPQTEEEKFDNRFMTIVAEDLAMSSGRSVRETARWITCGNEQVGGGEVLINLNLADYLE